MDESQLANEEHILLTGAPGVEVAGLAFEPERAQACPTEARHVTHARAFTGEREETDRQGTQRARGARLRVWGPASLGGKSEARKE